MNKKVEFNYQQTGLTKEDVLTPGEIEKYKKTFDMQKVKKGTVAAVGASTILVSSLTANADFSSKIIPKDVFGKKIENTIMMEEKEEAEIEIVETKEKVVAEKKAKATTEKEKVVTPKEEKPVVTLAQVKENSEKVIEEKIDALEISEHEAEFLNAIKKGAFESWTKYGILPSVLAGQAVVESDWGTSELALYANALFGVKASYWDGKTYVKNTREVYDGKEEYVDAAFRAYDSWDQSMEDHGEFLSKKRYAKAVGEKDYKVSIKAIHDAGYATDPEYVGKVTTAIESYNLALWDQEVIGAYDAYIANLGPADMDAFVSFLNNTTSEKRLEKIAKLTKEEAIETFKAVGAEEMKNWKNAEMEAIFKAFKDEKMDKFLHGDYKNKYLDKVAALALVIVGEAKPTEAQASELHTMEIAIQGQVKVGDYVLKDKAGIEAYASFENKINNISTDYAHVLVSEINADFSGLTFVLDPGHGGGDIGAPNIYANGKDESKQNLAIVYALKAALESKGATVYLTNDGTSYVELEDRVRLAVEKDADLFLSIHFNSNGDRAADGTEVFYASDSEESKKLAQSLFGYQKQALPTLETRGNGANMKNYEVLRHARTAGIPAALTEALFMSNPYEVLLLDNENVQTSLVNGYVAGLADYFGLAKEEVKEETKQETTEEVSEKTPDANDAKSSEEKTEEKEATTVEGEEEETKSEETAPEGETKTEEKPSEETKPEDVTSEKTSEEEKSEATKEIKTEEEDSESSEISSPTAKTNIEKKESFFLFDMFDTFATK